MQLRASVPALLPPDLEAKGSDAAPTVPAPTSGVVAQSDVTPSAAAVVPIEAAAANDALEVLRGWLPTRGPAVPGESPLSWMALAATRRERAEQEQVAVPPPAAAAGPELVSAGVMSAVDGAAAVAAGNPIAAFLAGVRAFVDSIVMLLSAPNPVAALFATFNNQSPRMSPTVTSQGRSGVITGNLNAVDPDSPTLTYTVTADPAHGVAVVNPDGTFTYTPDPALARAGFTDSFEVTVSDQASGFHISGLSGLLNLLTFGLLGDSGNSSTSTVRLTVAPVNAAPTAVARVTDTDPATGVVTGTVIGDDADGDTLTYSGSTTTATGAVTVDARTGDFIYVPTAAARHEAATDTFVVTVSDGYGGSAAVSVTVGLDGTNTIPTGMAAVGTPDAATAIVTGTITGTDPDGDSLTYSGSTITAKGGVVVRPDGTFTYTPNGSASHDAAAAYPVIATIAGLQSPVGIAISRDGSRAYVVDSYTSSLSVIDTATNTVTSTISGLSSPFGIALSTDETHAYVANVGGSVSLVDLATGTSTPAVTGLSSAFGVALSPDGTHLYVAGGDSLAVVDTDTYEVTATVAGLNLAYGVAVSPDGNRVYVSELTGQQVSVIETRSNTVTSTITGFVYPVGLAVSADGRRLYAANFYGGNVTVLDTLTDAVSSIVPGFGAPVALAVGSNDRLYVTDPGAQSNSETVIVLRATSATETDSFTVTVDDGYGQCRAVKRVTCVAIVTRRKRS